MGRVSFFNLILGCFCLVGLSSCLKPTEGSSVSNVIFNALDGCPANQCVYVSLKVTTQDGKKELIKPEMASIDTGAGGDLKKEDSPYLFTLTYYSTDKKASYANKEPFPVDFSKSKDGVLDVTIPVTKQDGSVEGANQLTGQSTLITKTTVKGVISETDKKNVPAEIVQAAEKAGCTIGYSVAETGSSSGVAFLDCKGSANIDLPSLNGKSKGSDGESCASDPKNSVEYGTGLPNTATKFGLNYSSGSGMYVHSYCGYYGNTCITYCANCARPVVTVARFAAGAVGTAAQLAANTARAGVQATATVVRGAVQGTRAVLGGVCRFLFGY